MHETLTYASNLGVVFTLGPTTVSRVEKGVEQQLSLSDVVRVRALLLGGAGVLELVPREGRPFVVVSSHEIGRGSPRLKEPARSEYRAFATELHRRIVAAAPSTKFVRGLIFKRAYDPLALPDAMMP